MKKSFLSVFVLLTVLGNGCVPAATPPLLTATPFPATASPIPPTSTPEPTATPVVYDVTIDVVDENGTPIPDVKIIQGKTVELTDNKGVWHKSYPTPELSINIWAQGYQAQENSSTLKPGDNKIHLQLAADPLGLKAADLAKEGYKLVFVEDFQDNSIDCLVDGNANIEKDSTKPENNLLTVDLRNLADQGFLCSFGPTNIQDAIIEADFRYVEIKYSDFKKDDFYHWQGYSINFRDGFDVEGYPLQVPWGPTLQIRDYTGSEWKFPVTLRQSIKENRWYKFNTRYDGKRVEVRMDGSLKFNYLKPPTMTNTKQASIGAFGQAYIQFDNIKMWLPNK
jgi:hypothetical protein